MNSFFPCCSFLSCILTHTHTHTHTHTLSPFLFISISSPDAAAQAVVTPAKETKKPDAAAPAETKKEDDKKEKTKKDEITKKEESAKTLDVPHSSGFAIAVLRLIKSLDGAGGEVEILRPRLSVHASNTSTLTAPDLIKWEGDKNILSAELDEKDEYNWQSWCLNKNGDDKTNKSMFAHDFDTMAEGATDPGELYLFGTYLVLILSLFSNSAK